MKSGHCVLFAGFVLLCACDETDQTSESRFSPEAQATSGAGKAVVPQPNPENYQVASPGPLQLDEARRVNLPRRSTGNSPPMISPDGTRFLAYNAIQGLWFGQIASNDEPKHPVGRVSGAGFGHAETIPFAWSERSPTILGARQATADPSGFALGPMSPVEISFDGRVQDLPKLAHPAGNLDGLLWVGGRGLALALFGAKGSYYRPEIKNHAPAMAIVNGREGRVIQSTAIPAPVDNNGSALISAVDALIDAKGRVFALLALTGHPNRSRWFVWHQNAPLRELQLNTERLRPERFSVSPDTKTVLIMHDLSATGVICEIWSKRDCPPPVPVSGTVADLRDLKTGEILWAIKGTAIDFGISLKPAISDDGSLALIAMPRTGEGGASFALISMKDGRIIQRLDGLPTFIDGIGFRDNDRSVWLSGNELVLTYQLSR